MRLNWRSATFSDWLGIRIIDPVPAAKVWPAKGVVLGWVGMTRVAVVTLAVRPSTMEGAPEFLPIRGRSSSSAWRNLQLKLGMALNRILRNSAKSRRWGCRIGLSNPKLQSRNWNELWCPVDGQVDARSIGEGIACPKLTTVS